MDREHDYLANLFGLSGKVSSTVISLPGYSLFRINSICKGCSNFSLSFFPDKSDEFQTDPSNELLFLVFEFINIRNITIIITIGIMKKILLIMKNNNIINIDKYQYIRGYQSLTGSSNLMGKLLN